MSDDLHTQIEQYTAAVIDRQRPITTDEAKASIAAIRELPEVELRTATSWWRRMGMAAAAAGLMLLFIGLVPFLLTSDEAQPADTLAPTTPAESTPTTLDELVLIPGIWTRVPHDEMVFGGDGEQAMGSVTVGGPGLVAVGSDGDPFVKNADTNAAVWTSVDGVTWSRVPHDEAVFGGGSLRMNSVTVGGPGLVAVGWDGRILADIPDVDAAIWTSVDGITWSRVSHDEEVFGAAFMNSVTVGGPGLVAVGMDGPWGDGDAAVWTSVDGITWNRVPHDETVFGGVDSQVIHDVTAWGSGLVAVGNDGGRGPWDNNPENNAAVWTSLDGVNWSRVLGLGANPVMLSVTAGGPGLVAVGADWWPRNLAETPVWTSPDGVTWTRVPDNVTVRGFMTSVTAGGPGLVAVGSDISEGTAVWTSVDGISWSRVPHDDAVFGTYPDWIFDVTAGGPGLVAVGWDGGDAAVWVTEED